MFTEFYPLCLLPLSPFYNVESEASSFAHSWMYCQERAEPEFESRYASFQVYAPLKIGSYFANMRKAAEQIVKV